MADGADQLPSGRRATISPEPKRIEPRNPTLSAVNTAIPWHSVSHGYLARFSVEISYLGPREYLTWDFSIDLEFRVDEGFENRSGLFALACGTWSARSQPCG